LKLDPRSVMQFAVIAEELSFTRAAQRLGVAQPWLSARLRKLEEQLGFQLLARDNRNVALTERGAEFLQAARAVAAAVNAAEALASQLQRLEASTLRLGVGPYSFNLPARRNLVGCFTADHQNVQIELDIDWFVPLLERVRSGNLDLAFLMGNIDHEDLESIQVCTVGVHLLMSRHDPLSEKDRIAPQDLAGRTVAVFIRKLNPSLFDHVFAPLIEAGAMLLHVPELNAAIFERIDSPDQVIATVLDSEAFLHQPDRRFVRRRLECSMAAPISLVRRRDVETPASRALWNMALQAYAPMDKK
jgi:DNA-binding transcriptional LysR family regulator